MQDPDRSTAGFSSLADPAIDELNALRPISRLALIALIVGLLSGLAMFHNVLWVVPIVGIAVSAIALRQTSGPDSIYTGRRAAVAGLFLSLMFGTLVIIKHKTEDRVASQQAVEFAERWLKIVQSGNMPQAVEWMQMPGRRRDPDSDLAKFYATDEDAREHLKSVTSTDAIKRLKAIGTPDDQNSGPVQYIGIDTSARAGDTYLFSVRFAMPDIDGKKSPPIICHVRRSLEYNRTRWTIDNVEDAEPES